jgi:alpha-tubulin suppressor-like RCC1 family protein
MKANLIALAGLLLLIPGCADDATEPTTASHAVAPAVEPAAVAATLAFWQVSAGATYSCGVSTDFVPYCWGDNRLGQLGVGTDTGPDVCRDAAGGAFACAMRPSLVLGGHHFRRVSSGGGQTCGVTADFHAWCWGNNPTGAVGSGSTLPAFKPVAVVGGHLFRQVETGTGHTCGITSPDNRLFCWGDNSSGQLGDGSVSRRLTPVPVLSDLQFSQVTAGGVHTCALSTTGRAFCWGLNTSGQLGDSTNATRRTRPVPVVGAHTFRQMDAGFKHTCAVTTDDRAFCWGYGQYGQLGTGKTYLSFWPRAVKGSLRIRRVAAGGLHTCAETLSSTVYCWGNNTRGELGIGAPQPAQVLSPVAVAGGLSFAQIGAGASHSCGKTPAGVGYCWGDGFYGALGDGTGGYPRFSAVPVAVAAPH